jgi:hypothetical protein
MRFNQEAQRHLQLDKLKGWGGGGGVAFRCLTIDIGGYKPCSMVRKMAANRYSAVSETISVHCRVPGYFYWE